MVFIKYQLFRIKYHNFILIMNMNGEPSFNNIKKLCEPHIIFKESAAKLIRLTKFGLLQYRYGIVLVTRNLLTDGRDHKEIFAKQARIRSSISKINCLDYG